jgi:hypothetical protein
VGGGNGANAGTVTVWRRGRGGFKALQALADPGGAVTHLRIDADGRGYRFAVSSDGVTWTTSRALRGPVEETARIALTAGGSPGASARFTRATLLER